MCASMKSYMEPPVYMFPYTVATIPPTDFAMYVRSMYTMRMLDSAHNNASSNSSVLGAVGGATSLSGAASAGLGATTVGDRLDASSDSAVSSMGSERVPSLSDGEWGDAGSDSAQDYHQSKYGPYDYSYSGRISSDTTSARQAPVAQKKHHMFGKRYFQEQNTSVVATPPISALLPHPSATGTPSALPTIKYEYDSHYPTMPHHTPGALEGAVGPKSSEMKYSCTMDFARQQNTRASMEHISHNHTYHLPQSNGATPRPQARDKKSRRSEEEHLTRDEKRARALNVPILVQDIINLPMDEFNERLSKYDLSEPQLSLIRDIRRRGKNKVAAQNCRKRKLDQIVTLADEVKDMKDRKMRLLRERDQVMSERQRVKDKFAQLYRHVFQNLRDADGNPYSQYQYSLQQSADGSVVLVPRANHSILDQSGSSSNSSDSQSSNSRNPHNQQRKE